MMTKNCEANEVEVSASPVGLTPMIGLAELSEHFQVSTDTILRWVDDSGFPAPMRTGRRLLRWRVDKVNEWIEQQTPETRAE